MAKRRRPHVRVPAFDRLGLRYAFLDRCGEIEPLRRELAELVEAAQADMPSDPLPLSEWHWQLRTEGSPWPARFEAFAERWGLTFDDDQGLRAVYECCRQRRCFGRRWQPGWLKTCIGEGYSLPDTGDGESLTIDWEPEEESREDAERRVLKAVRDLMRTHFDQIEAAYREAGLDRARWRKRSREADHLGWLVAYQVERRTFADIAADTPMVDSAEAVRKPVHRLAEAMGLTLREPHPGGRPRGV